EGLAPNGLVHRSPRRPGPTPVVPGDERTGYVLEIGKRHPVGNETRRPMRDRRGDARIDGLFSRCGCHRGYPCCRSEECATNVARIPRSRVEDAQSVIRATKEGRQMFEAFRRFVAELSGGDAHPSRFDENDYRLAAVALLVHTAAIDGTISDLER